MQQLQHSRDAFFRVYGTRGILDYNRELKTLTFQGEDVDRKPSPLEYLKYEENDTLLEEMEEFAYCILQGKKPETGVIEAFNVLAVIEAALISQKENKFIDVEKI